MRNGLKKTAGPTEFGRVMLLMSSNPEKAIAIADAALKAKPKDQSLRFVKALAFYNLEMNPEQENELIKLLRELSDENFPPAIYRLANFLNESEDEKESKEAIALYERYTQLEPHDTRGIHSLAVAYDTAGDGCSTCPAEYGAARRDRLYSSETIEVGFNVEVCAASTRDR